MNIFWVLNYATAKMNSIGISNMPEDMAFSSYNALPHFIRNQTGHNATKKSYINKLIKVILIVT